ncbi:tetratricopeptide repeat protein [Enterococcus sp. AZ194]|uniref:tetratricopeptide repeat protein n=1 Tax=Enterococcus sp. AZ194 TaxID=2774629 RepID=UPI003F68703C
MFGNKKEKKKVVQEDSSLSEDQKKELSAEIEQHQLAISDLENQLSTDPTLLARKYERIGLIYEMLGEIDLAISTLEKSLDLKLSIDDGYKKLMGLYNKKRAAAAKNGDDSGIEYYMQKMDDMRQIAKKVTITG